MPLSFVHPVHRATHRIGLYLDKLDEPALTQSDKTGARITVAEAILRSWAESKVPILQKAFMEYSFGKVPDKLETNPLGDRKTLILHYGHERPKAERLT